MHFDIYIDVLCVPAYRSRDGTDTQRLDRLRSGCYTRGVDFDLLHMAKRVGPQCEAAEHEDLSGEKSLALDRVVVDD